MRQPGNASAESNGRRLAEWVSLGISALLILGLMVFLVHEALEAQDPYAAPRARALLDEARQVQGLYVLPVEVQSAGIQTLRDVEVGLSYVDAQGMRHALEARIDYLGEGSSQRLYFLLVEDPHRVRIDVRPLHYRLE